jgi:hypothetical protein
VQEYSYDELLGPLDNQIVNPCRGPFPYKYRFNYYIYQETIETNGTIKATGDACAPLICVQRTVPA